MDKKRRIKSQDLKYLIMEDDDSGRKPKFSTTISGWTSTKDEPGDLNLVHGFLGIRVKIPRESLTNVKPNAIKFRINNKYQYEPFLEGSDRRVYDIIQLCPKEFIFSPPAEMTLRLPSAVHEKSTGQVICMFSNSYGIRNDSTRYLKWGRISSKLFIINNQRSEAKVICKYAGFYTLVVTRCPEVTAKISPGIALTFYLQDVPGIKIKYEKNTVDVHTKVTVKVVCLEDLYNSPSASPTSPNPRRRFPIQYREDKVDTNDEMVDVTGSPVVLIRPIKTRFSKPVWLSLPLLGDEFEGFFDKESSRIVVLKSKELEDESIVWHHHYSTPEVETTSRNTKVATFLVTCGGLYKVVRRFPNKHMRFIEQVSSRISRELCHDTSPDIMVTSVLKGLITEIAEPGKQFVLRICLLDSSQPRNPDNCFTYEVCSQVLTVPLGKVRFLVRGRFEPDRDAADHSEERTVMFTGKTTIVDFNLKLRLSDPSKLPEHIGKVTVHSSSELQYFINLHKPTPIPKEVLNNEPENGSRRPQTLKEKKQVLRRHAVSSMKAAKVSDSIKESTIEEDESGSVCSQDGSSSKSNSDKDAIEKRPLSNNDEDSMSSKGSTSSSLDDESMEKSLSSDESRTSNLHTETQDQVNPKRPANNLSKSCASGSQPSLRSNTFGDTIEPAVEYDDDWPESNDVTDEVLEKIARANEYNYEDDKLDDEATDLQETESRGRSRTESRSRYYTKDEENDRERNGSFTSVDYQPDYDSLTSSSVSIDNPDDIDK